MKTAGDERVRVTRAAVCVGLVLVVSIGGPCARHAVAQPAPTVTVTGGQVRGQLLEGGGAAFLGVPFAQPPVGQLRWREPMKVKPWPGARDATAYGPTCAQMGRQGPSGSDDCLYLNVWVPRWPVSSQVPVMLWLYGGANATGSASNPTFDGAKLARRGVIVVTANYRIGVMGFMAHPALSGESPHHASSNYGLLDALMALQWIQNNARQFGGDPRRVTLFGQSSGSFDVQVLMASPLSKGLFHAAIAESGQMTSFAGTMVKGRAERIGEQIADALQAPRETDALAFLRALPSERVVAAAAPFLPTGLDSDTGLLTSVDGWVLPRHPVEVFAEGKQLPIPLVVGSNAREITQPFTNAELRKTIEKKYGPGLAAGAIEAYGIAGDTEPQPDPLYGSAGAQWMTDIVQRCGTVALARYHSAAGHPTYQYQFDRVTPGRESAGSTHGAEVVYVFGTMGRPGDTVAWSDAERKASDVIQQYWTNFAQTGNPNGRSLPEWPRYEPATARYLEFSADGPVTNANIRPVHCGIFLEWVRQHMKVPR
jgi:para-nitrobenzyl esterase